MGFCPYALRDVSVASEPTLGHLRYFITDVPPQPNSQTVSFHRYRVFMIGSIKIRELPPLQVSSPRAEDPGSSGQFLRLPFCAQTNPLGATRMNRPEIQGDEPPGPPSRYELQLKFKGLRGPPSIRQSGRAQIAPDVFLGLTSPRGRHESTLCDITQPSCPDLRVSASSRI